jgi:pilus assembly protein CpaE
MNLSLGTAGRSRILVCSQDKDTIKTIDNVISSFAAFETTVLSPDSFLQNKAFEADAVDTAIIDIGSGAMLDNPRLAEARARFGNVPVIFISDELAPDRMRQLMRLDGTDWLPKPVQARLLIDTVNSITKRLKANANKVHAVLPCGGGAGGTSVSIMLAYYLSRPRKRSTPTAALFDLDFSAAPGSAYLNAESGYDLSEVLGRAERIDLEFIDIIKRKHESGFSIFSSSAPMLMTNPGAAELVLRMLDIVAFQHDHTVVDLASCEALWNEDVLKAVNSAVIVTTNSVPALRRAKEVLGWATDVRGNAKDITIVINKVRGGLFTAGIKSKDVQRIFGETPAVILPDESDVMTESLNRGVLPLEVSSRSRFCSQVRAMAEQLALVPGVTR